MEDIKNKIRLGSGCSGTCYLIDNDTVKKEYFDKIPDTQKSTLGTINPKYTFAYYADWNQNFTLMPYQKALHIRQNNNSKKLANPTVAEFSHDIPNLYAATDELSMDSICIYDLAGVNILFGEDGFHIIDTDKYEKQTGNNIKNKNIISVNIGLFNALFDVCDSAYDFVKVLNARDLNILFTQLISSTSDNRVFKEFLMTLKYFLENYYEKEIDTIENLQQTIRVFTRK